MEVTALCLQIFMNLFVLLSTQLVPDYTLHKPTFPIITPDRLQFFEYESLFISCGENKDMTARRVMRKLHNMSPANKSDNCSIQAPSCTIHHIFESHSGKYWCENDEGERSQPLNISVTAGRVILKLPAQPVEEGSDLTLCCITKNTKETHIRDFYKDGFLLTTHYKTNLTLYNVSKSDEGFYKCIISHAGESPESWLAVVKQKEGEGSDEEMQSLTNPPFVLILLSTIFTLLFLVTGRFLYKKHRALNNETVSDPKNTTYASVNKPRKRNDGDTANDGNNLTYAAVEIRKQGSKVSVATTEQFSSEPEPVYSLITLQKTNIN